MSYIGVFFIILGCVLLCVSIHNSQRKLRVAEGRKLDMDRTIEHLYTDRSYVKNSDLGIVVKTVITKVDNHRQLFVYGENDKLLYSRVIW